MSGWREYNGDERRTPVASSSQTFGLGSFSWLRMGERQKDPKNLKSIMNPSEIALALRQAVELNDEPHSNAAIEIMITMAEEGGSDIVVSLGSAGVCAPLDQLLGINVASPMACEMCLRAIAILCTQAANRLKFGGAGALSKIVKAIHGKKFIEVGGS